ncbi:hypothetical protein SEA_PHERRYCRUZ_38 [Streptomyces phage PherryCruz]|nr:hypothetical protein SEA_PHERRYCRUZ_38 [Streptomyces phage PherryCruz]UVK63628.1 hypothetical protein SEA_DOXI13_39 [Streptomyces phage Doxi13]
MFVRLLLAAALSPLGREILIDLYKKYVSTTPRPYTRKDYNR